MKTACVGFWACLLVLCFVPGLSARADDGKRREYKILATNKTSTMEKEMNEAATAGFQFVAVMAAKHPSVGRRL